MRAMHIPPAVLAGALLAACGGDEKTTTVVRTVSAPATAQATPVPRPGAAEPGPQAAPDPFPSGETGVDGIYIMTALGSDYVGEPISSDNVDPRRTQWSFRSDCRAGSCAVRMGREMPMGGIKRLTLRPTPERPGVYVARSSGQGRCALPAGTIHYVNVRQRYAVRLLEPRMAERGQVADRIEVHLTEATNACPTKPSRGTVRWSGRPTQR